MRMQINIEIEKVCPACENCRFVDLKYDSLTADGNEIFRQYKCEHADLCKHIYEVAVEAVRQEETGEEG